MSDEKDLPAFTPPDGLPGPQELKHRREQAGGILEGRGIRVETRPDMLMLNALVRLIRARLDVGDDEWNYYGELAAVEGLEQVVEMSAPKPVIHLASVKGGKLS